MIRTVFIIVCNICGHDQQTAGKSIEDARIKAKDQGWVSEWNPKTERIEDLCNLCYADREFAAIRPAEVDP